MKYSIVNRRPNFFVVLWWWICLRRETNTNAVVFSVPFCLKGKIFLDRRQLSLIKTWEISRQWTFAGLRSIFVLSPQLFSRYEFCCIQKHIGCDTRRNGKRQMFSTLRPFTLWFSWRLHNFSSNCLGFYDDFNFFKIFKIHGRFPTTRWARKSSYFKNFIASKVPYRFE